MLPSHPLPSRPSLPTEPFAKVSEQDAALFAELGAVDGEQDRIEGVVDEVGLVEHGDEHALHRVEVPV